MIGDVLGIANTIVDKVGDLFPSKEAKDSAKAKLVEMQSKGELADVELGMTAIIAEAKSKDKFTSRARPTFMYVFYLIVLFAIPVGILNAVNPDVGTAFAQGMKDWWASLPTELWWTFGVGFTGYSTLRSVDKSGLLKTKKPGL